MANRNTNICFSEKAETVYFWQNSKSDGKESDRRGKNDEIDKKTKCGKKHQAKEQQLGLYPGLSVSCDDICGRFCNERSLSFWGKFGACC
ncbi:MAG: hypothetical protein ACLUTH_12600 [Blautia massiliensis (ex Durand et al. 2017)]